MPLLRTLTAVSAGLAAAVALTACGGSEPLASGETEAIVIGSQDYYSNEIIAEIYAQALEAAGHEVVREFRIGQREVYVPEIESGAIDLFPEYTGPLLQYWEPDTEARLADEVYTALQDATPEGLRLLDQSPATDQDSYTVTRAFAEQWGLETIADLAKVSDPLTLGGNSEGEARPNGPSGLEATYGVTVAFTPIEDGGGPLTVKALQDGDIQLAIIYTLIRPCRRTTWTAWKTRRGSSSPPTSCRSPATTSMTRQRPSSTRSAQRCPPTISWA